MLRSRHLALRKIKNCVIGEIGIIGAIENHFYPNSQFSTSLALFLLLFGARGEVGKGNFSLSLICLHIFLLFSVCTHSGPPFLHILVIFNFN